jgi:hypothetical protein
MSAARRLALGLAAALLGGCPTASPEGPADAARLSPCDEPAQVEGTIDRLELGGRDDVFTPFVAGEQVEMLLGPGGGVLFGLRIRSFGLDVPGCLAQTTEVDGADGPLALDSRRWANPLEPDGQSHATGIVWMVLALTRTDPGGPATIRTEANGVTVELGVQLGWPR